MERSRSAIKDKIAKKEKKKDKKKKKKQLSSSDSESALNMSENDGGSEVNGATGSDVPSEMLPAQNRLRQDENELDEENERRKNREPAIVFKDLDVRV